MGKKKTLSRDNIVCAIGYDGPVALVDKTSRAKYGNLPTSELVRLAQYRAAAAAAVHSGKPEELALVASSYNSLSGSSYKPEEMLRLFGVGPVTVTRILAL